MHLAKNEADPETLKSISGRDKLTNKPENFNQIKYKLINNPKEERLSKEYGKLINSITSSLLDMVEVSGFFKVLTAVSKPLRLLFENSIGSGMLILFAFVFFVFVLTAFFVMKLALSVALESTVEEDLRKVRFGMSLLFDDELAKSK